MTIAIIGWGSLIWCPGALRIKSRWRREGPRLPIEYARISADGRLTLVIHEANVEQKKSDDVQAYWAVSSCEATKDAIENLRQGEHTRKEYIHCLLSTGETCHGQIAETISSRMAEWFARNSDVGAPVRTALPSNWTEKRGKPFNPADAVIYIRELEAAADNTKAAVT